MPVWSTLRNLLRCKAFPLKSTWVTEEGVKRLQRALPEAKINH